MHMLVAGAQGQLGVRLMEAAAVAGVSVTGLDREGMDVASRDSVEAALDSVQPTVVINAAAYTAVDMAESQREAAMAVNARGTQHLAEACQVRGIPLIHVSTDYVFGQAPRRPLLPSDMPCPEGVYAESKRLGEEAFLASGVCGCVIRVSWLYDVQGANFLQTMLRLAEAHGTLSVVNDQHGVPTAAPLLAQALVEVAKLGKDMPQGIWHHSHQGHTTWHGFASAIMEVAGVGGARVACGHVGLPHGGSSTGLERVGWRALEGADGVAFCDVARGVGGLLVVQKRCLNFVVP